MEQVREPRFIVVVVVVVQLKTYDSNMSKEFFSPYYYYYYFSSSPRLFSSIIYWLCCTSQRHVATWTFGILQNEMRQSITLCCKQKEKCRRGVLSITYVSMLFIWFLFFFTLSLRQSTVDKRIYIIILRVVEKWFASGNCTKSNVTISICVLMWFRVKIFSSHHRDVEIKGFQQHQ